MLGILLDFFCFIYNHSYVLSCSHQLIEEVEELKAFKKEHSVKIGLLEHKLVRNTMLCLLNIRYISVSLLFFFCGVI